jgi:hypothetical protein
MRPVVRVSALTSFIRYMYIFYCKLQFLNHVIIIKTKVLLAQAYVTMTDFWLGYHSSDKPKYLKANKKLKYLLASNKTADMHVGHK